MSSTHPFLGFSHTALVAQCGNFVIFYHSDFAWNQFWVFIKCNIGHFHTFTGTEFWFLWIFFTFYCQEFTKLTKCKAPKLTKTYKIDFTQDLNNTNNPEIATLGIVFTEFFRETNMKPYLRCCSRSSKIPSIFKPQPSSGTRST